MAYSKRSNLPDVLLGFADELVSEKHVNSVSYCTNKIGGNPDWPFDGIVSPRCQLCGLSQPLVLQIYAPLDNTSYHRTLYIFACINPNCWNQNQSWTCYRSQLYDTDYETEIQATALTNKPQTVSTDWCSGAGDWDDDDNGNFENGNIISNFPSKSHTCPSDESDDSSSLSTSMGILNLHECNANWGGAAAANSEKGSGAVGKMATPPATAEIECDESEVVSIDTPTEPQHDLIALLQESNPIPYHLQMREDNKSLSIHFVSMFISVAEESSPDLNHMSDHVKELMQEYQLTNDENCSSQESDSNHPTTEGYEKCVPAHGDAMFHRFLSKLQMNPGQILRYCREHWAPLLLYPVHDVPKRCTYCREELIFEMQILPTLIPKLRLPGQDSIHLEFGTVLIFTCSRSCWNVEDKWREESVVVQVERV